MSRSQATQRRSRRRPRIGNTGETTRLASAGKRMLIRGNASSSPIREWWEVLRSISMSRSLLGVHLRSS